MQEKLVKRYTCDFCRKKKYAKGAMAKHEKHCTLNPNRECGMCKIAGRASPTPDELAGLIAMFPLDKFDFSNSGQSILLGLWPTMADSLHDCPACIMAVLRQANIPIWLAGDWWKYTDACKKFWEGKSRPSNAPTCLALINQMSKAEGI